MIAGLAVVFGYLSAVHAGKFTDRALTILSLAGISIPVFWLAAILLYYLSFKAQLFPTSSYVPFTKDPGQWVYHLILPWITLATVQAAVYTRLMRGQLLSTLGEDYIRTARAKGLSERRVIWRHGVRSAITPVVTIFGLDVGWVRALVEAR